MISPGEPLDILFKVEDPSINNRESLFDYILALKKEYSSKLLQLAKRRDKLLGTFDRTALASLIDDHSELVNFYVKILLRYFEQQIAGRDFCVFWTGGFARGTNRLGGDFDLNFLYSDPGLRVVEEQLSLALSIISGKPRDYIHSVIMRDCDINYDKAKNGLNLVMRWGNDPSSDYRYAISPGLEKLIYQGLNAPRDEKYLLQKLKDNIEEESCHDWVTNRKAVVNDEAIEKIFGEIYRLEKKILKSHKKYDDLVERSRLKLQLRIENGHMQTVSQIKERYKKVPFENIFTFLALLRRRLIIDGRECVTLDLKSLYENKQIKKLLGKTAHEILFEGIYQYIWVVVRLEAIFEKRQIRFGIHNHDQVDINYFDRVCKKCCKDVEDVQQYHEQALMKLNALLDKMLNLIKYNLPQKSTYGIAAEYTNILGYSPFWFLNEVSARYRYQGFHMPIIEFDGTTVPVHPHTLEDRLRDKDYKIINEVKVYPTSSFRSVYEPKHNACYKLPIFRQITRGLRDLPSSELERSCLAGEAISRYRWPGFVALAEECHFHQDETFNYLIRKMPSNPSVPWFYVISSQKFSKDFELAVAAKLIKSWMFFASKGIFLEYHTQNIIVDHDQNIYYRDLSDVRSYTIEGLRPSYVSCGLNSEEVMAVIFDRTFCKQNLSHLFRYSNRLKESDKAMLKKVIRSEIIKYNLNFPNYSFDFPANQAVRTPIREKLIEWRS